MLRKNKLGEYILMTIAFLLPVYQDVIAYAIILAVLLWIFSGNFIAKFNKLLNSGTGLLFIGFYLLYVIGMIYTENTHYGSFDLEVKLTLLIFPLLFLSGAKEFDSINKQNVFKSFVIGSFLIATYLLIRATYYYFQTWDMSVYTYIKLSHAMHPSYLAMYFNFSLILLYLGTIKNKISVFKLSVRLFMILFFIISIILLSSKAGILSLILCLLIMFLHLLIKKKFLAVSIVTALSLLLFIMVIIFAKSTTDRIKTAVYVLMHPESVTNKSDESTSERILIWNASKKIICAHPIFGVGTGDVKDALIFEYKKDKVQFAVEKSLNAHSQYFQTCIALGLAGIGLLLLTLLLPFYMSIKYRYWDYILFLTIFIVNLLFESMLERQAGVIFYAFFNSLLFAKLIQIKSNKLQIISTGSDN